VIETDSQLAEVLPRVRAVDRVAVDTEADSLHCYFEKLCLIQLTVEEQDYLIDPLAPLDLQPLCAALAEKEIVLQGMDFDLRLLRRTLGFSASKVFDTVIASRLLGLREFSLAALVQQYFSVTLAKGSQKANWARRPLPPVMKEYARNDTHYLLPLAAKMEAALDERGRMEWFRQSCQRALDQAAVRRERDPDQAWRIAGSGTLPARTNALLRALWNWRDREAQRADRPAFHILQNSTLLDAAARFAAGETPDYRHFSARRRQGFLEAAQEALALPENQWPARPPRLHKPRTRALDKRVEELKRRRDQHAAALELEPSFIASRTALESIAAEPGTSETILVQWQRELLGV
jgi:ribonuclease D